MIGIKEIRVFGTPTCPKCQKMRPLIMELIEKDKLNIQINMLEGNEELFFKEEIEGYPTLKFYNDGVFYDKLTGITTKEEIIKKYKEV